MTGRASFDQLLLNYSLIMPSTYMLTSNRVTSRTINRKSSYSIWVPNGPTILHGSTVVKQLCWATKKDVLVNVIKLYKHQWIWECEYVVSEMCGEWIECMRNRSTPHVKRNFTQHVTSQHVLLCLSYMYCTLYILYILHTVHIVHVSLFPCFPCLSDVEASSSTSVHSCLFTHVHTLLSNHKCTFT